MTDLQAFKAMMQEGRLIGTRFPNGEIVARRVAVVKPTRVGFYSHRHTDGTISWSDWPKAKELSRFRDTFTIISPGGLERMYWVAEDTSEEN